MNKPQIRANMLKLRSALSSAEINEAADAATPLILDCLKQLAKAKESDIPLNVMSYMSYKNEFPTHALNQTLLEAGFSLILPYTDEDFNIHIYQVSSLDELVKNSMGILEPSIENPEFPASMIDIILVPGVAFDLRGNRIGFGKGCYDRFIHSTGISVPLAALCYDFQIADSLPADPLDVPMTCIISPSGISKCL